MRQLNTEGKFLSTLSELFALFLVHPCNNFNTAVEYKDVDVDYNPEGEGADIVLRFPNGGRDVAIEVAYLAGPNEAIDHSSFGAVDGRIRKPLSKLEDVIENKRCQLVKHNPACYKLIALDISEYFVKDVFLGEDSVNHHIGGLLFGQSSFGLVFDLMNKTSHSTGFFNDPHSVVGQKGDDVNAWFSRAKEIGAVILFHRVVHCSSLYDDDPDRVSCLADVDSKLILNKYANSNDSIPYDIAFYLDRVMRGDVFNRCQSVSSFYYRNKDCSW